MRIKITTTPNTIPVAFDYQQKLVGTLHKWIGKNELHDDISLYSFSWLQGGRKAGNALRFERGASLFLSFHDELVMKKIIASILDAPEMFCGMRVVNITLVDDPDFTDCNYFLCASPILIKRRLEDGSTKQYNFNDSESGLLMKETLQKKMRKAGLPEDDTLDIQFDLSYAKKKTKLVHYDRIGNKASLCPVIIKGKPETKLFAWNVGLGNCTGAGFGALL